MQNNNSRRDFVKKLTFALGSFVALSSFKVDKTSKIEKQNFKTLSKSEVDNIIKNSSFTVINSIKPELSPNK